jgi:16S rRNA (guanine(1405)-N(7))-methyltransferase
VAPNPTADEVQAVIEAAQAGARYRAISPDLVRQVAAQELAKGRKFKETVKAVRNKLHQVGGAYQEEGIDYARWRAELARLPGHTPGDLSAPEVQDFCRRMMAQHASTRERLPVVERFFRESLASFPPLPAVLDLACGLNFLALPWIPLAPGGSYSGCDIYADLVDFGNELLAHFAIPGRLWVCNLAQETPPPPEETGGVVFLLKTIPCLEQIDKSIPGRLLSAYAARRLLVSFPSHSLGGRSKGMAQNYEAHFQELTARQNWSISKIEYPGELGFVIGE